MAKPKADLVGRLSGGYFAPTEDASQQGSEPENQEPVVRTKRTWYIADDLLISLQEYQAAEYKRTREKTSLSVFVEQALSEFLSRQQDSETA
ncbi:MAG TPA: hypothetical protein VIL69_20385 [Roseomonas sp.]|jgi:hypothetical protein